MEEEDRLISFRLSSFCCSWLLIRIFRFSYSSSNICIRSLSSLFSQNFSRIYFSISCLSSCSILLSLVACCTSRMSSFKMMRWCGSKPVSSKESEPWVMRRVMKELSWLVASSSSDDMGDATSSWQFKQQSRQFQEEQIREACKQEKIRIYFILTLPYNPIYLKFSRRRIMNFLKYLSSPFLDTTYSKLHKLHLLGPHFDQISLHEIRKLIKSSLSHKNEIEEILKEFNHQNMRVVPEQMLKALLFIHIVIQEYIEQPATRKQVLPALQDQVNKILNYSKQFIEKDKKEKHWGSFITGHKQETKNEASLNRTAGLKIKNRSLALTQFDTFRSQEASVSESVMERDGSKSEAIKPVSKEEVICRRIVWPYATFLIKILNNEDISTEDDLEIVHLWPLINSYQNMLNVTKKFSSTLRYYPDLIDLIIFIMKVFDSEIKSSYPIIEDAIAMKLKEIVKEYKQISENQDLNSEEKLIIFKQMRQGYEIEELKEVIEQLSILNDDILMMYFNKSVSLGIKKSKIYAPRLFPCSSNEIDVIHTILRETSEKKISKVEEREFLSSSLGRLDVSAPDVLMHKLSELSQELFKDKGKKMSDKIEELNDIEV